jgi:L-lysine 2,3-aminomutase
MLAKYTAKKQIVAVTHFDHPKEITACSVDALKALQKAGLVLRNQSVLLKGINDDAKTLALLHRNLMRCGVLPYYVFQCRPVRGTAVQFQVPLKRGYEIVEGAKAALDGQAKSFRYCMSHVTGKIEILGPDEISGNKGNMLFKYHEAKDATDNGRIFSRRIEDDRCWLDETEKEKEYA